MRCKAEHYFARKDSGIDGSMIVRYPASVSVLGALTALLFWSIFSTIAKPLFLDVVWE